MRKTSPAGKTIRKLFAALAPERQHSLTLFGSSPIQLGIDPTFTSNDVDLFGGEWGEAYVELDANPVGEAEQRLVESFRL